MKLFSGIIVSFLVNFTIHAQDSSIATKPGLRTSQPLTLFTANDGHSHIKFDVLSYTSNAPLRIERTNITKDSITVVHLGPDHPPILKTVFGSVPNTIWGAPYLATTPDGHYGFVPCHNNGVLWPKPGNILSMIDLTSSELKVVAKEEIDTPNLAVLHPNQRDLVVAYRGGFKVYDISSGTLGLKKDNPVGGSVDSFDISPAGDRLVGVFTRQGKTNGNSVHLYSFKDGIIGDEGEIRVRDGLPKFDQPFALRFSPDGKRVLVPNGGGLSSKGSFDDVLSVDMTLPKPEVTEVIRDVADGIESVAFHPKGHIVVFGCLQDFPPDAAVGFSDLAVVDLTTKPPQMLYRLDVEPCPEGMEFSPDGSQLFVELTTAHRIAVFDVDGFNLKRSPYVLRVGHAPSSMGIARRFGK